MRKQYTESHPAAYAIQRWVVITLMCIHGIHLLLFFLSADIGDVLKAAA